MTTEKTTEKKAQSQKKTDGKAQAAFFAGYEDLIGLGKENLEAAVKSSQLFAKGAEAINATLFQAAREAVEENIKASKAIMGCKTPEEFFEVQNDVARANYEKLLVESRKVTDMTVKLAEESAQPIAERVTASVEILTKNRAA